MLCDRCNSELADERSSLEPPPHLALPFFAYGVFRPGELAFLQIKEFVSHCSPTSINGSLRIRDGLPIASLEESGDIRGDLIRFKPGSEASAYQRITELEPEKQYRWQEFRIGAETVNLLAGVSPKKGSIYPDYEWDGLKDPLFTSALEVVEETLELNRTCDGSDLKPLFRLEMAYMLLWTAIERYASLRYHLRDRATQKVFQIASELAFRSALAATVGEPRSVQRADDPTKKCTLDSGNPDKSMAYYYQVRSNLVHRGKGMFEDHRRILMSLEELLTIFRVTLNAAFQESQWTKP